MLKPYRDTVGKLTIGYGRNLDDKGISRAEAEAMRDADIQDAAQSLLTHLSWAQSVMTNNPVRFWVLVDMLFNMGWGALAGFHNMLSACEAGNWRVAAQSGLASKWHDQVKGRADHLMRQLESGQW